MTHKYEQPQHTNSDLVASVDEAIENFSAFSGSDTFGVAIVLKKNLSQLDTKDQIIQAEALINDFTKEKQIFELTPALIRSTVTAIEYFEEDAIAGVPLLMELENIGELGKYEDLSSELTDVLDEFLDVTNGLDFNLPLKDLARILGISESVRGTELILKLTERFDEGISDEDKLALGLMSAESYHLIHENDERTIAQAYIDQTEEDEIPAPDPNKIFNEGINDDAMDYFDEEDSNIISILRPKKDNAKFEEDDSDDDIII